ncbi:MAG TPA: hypothetical protein VH372_18610 [Actinospica sp.]|nr:hypothetical protein [Actinospica sp.]
MTTVAVLGTGLMDAVESVMRRALDVIPRQAVWAQYATVGMDATRPSRN